MIITEAFLNKQRACKGGMKWFREFQGEKDHEAVINGLIADNQHDYANWLIVRLMTHEQNVRYAIYAAEQVIHLYAAKYPNDDKPQKAIQAAKDYLDGNATAADAADAADAAADAADAADAAADAAAYAADAAAYAADAAAYAADAANAAYAAAYAADAAAYAKEMKTKILRYGLTLIAEA